MMGSNDIVLRFEYPTNINADPRTVRINQIVEGSQGPIEFYKVPARPAPSSRPRPPRSAHIGRGVRRAAVLDCDADRRLCPPQFHHPNTGLTTGETSFQRKNLDTQVWENAGQIEWASNTSGAVYFGVERVRKPTPCPARARYSTRADPCASPPHRYQYESSASPRNHPASERPTPPPHLAAHCHPRSMLTRSPAPRTVLQLAQVQGERHRVQVEASRERHRHDCEPTHPPHPLHLIGHLHCHRHATRGASRRALALAGAGVRTPERRAQAPAKGPCRRASLPAPPACPSPCLLPPQIGRAHV